MSVLRNKISIDTVANQTTQLVLSSSRVRICIGSVVGQIYKLPDATELKVDDRFMFQNESTTDVTIQDYSGNILFVLLKDETLYTHIRDISSTAGIWSLNRMMKRRTLNEVYAYNMFSTAGTFNGITCGTSGAASLGSRWYFRSFTSANNDNCVACYNFTTPKSYIAGRDVEIKINFTYVSGSTGNIQWVCGLSRDDVIYNTDVSTTYQSDTVPCAIATDFNRKSYSFIFSGTNIKPNDPICIIIIRDTRAQSPDDLSATAYVNTMEVLMR